MSEEERLRKEVSEWRDCARYDPLMSGPAFKGWDRSALDRCRRKYIENAECSGENAYREIFGETVVEREIRKSLERSKELSGVQVNTWAEHEWRETAPIAEQNEQDDTKSP